MTKKERALKAIEALKELYPEAICSLNASNPFELLVATRLSAQCTDARVNLVTPALFERYKTVEDYAAADVKDIEKIIHSCGFYKSKAESIIDMAKGVRDRFGGTVPDNIEDLTTLNGVGRKTAERIVLELKDKTGSLSQTDFSSVASAASVAEDSAAGEAVAALVALGFSQSDAAVTVGQMDQSLSADEMIRLGLRQLSSNL